MAKCKEIISKMMLYDKHKGSSADSKDNLDIIIIDTIKIRE